MACVRIRGACSGRLWRHRREERTHAQSSEKRDVAMHATGISSTHAHEQQQQQRSSADAPAGVSQTEEYLAKKAERVSSALDQLVQPHYPEKVTQAMRYSLLAGGKRIRPALCIAACEMLGGTEDTALPAACAIELMHTMSLVHDDLPAMDNDDFRRGQPTNHKQFGVDFAILAGDALLAKSFEAVAASPELWRSVPPERVVRVLAELSRTAGSSGLVGGQALDILTERGEIETGVEHLDFIHERKTGRLLQAAVVCGAILAGASDDDIARVTKYAQNLGLSFQIVDDVLDVTSTSEQLGKTAGKDESAGKATYPTLVGTERSLQIADDLIAEAKAQLQPYDTTLAAPLYALADYITARRS